MKKILILLAFVIVGMACKEDNTNEAPSIIVPGTENLKPTFHPQVEMLLYRLQPVKNGQLQ